MHPQEEHRTPGAQLNLQPGGEQSHQEVREALHLRERQHQQRLLQLRGLDHLTKKGVVSVGGDVERRARVRGRSAGGLSA